VEAGYDGDDEDDPSPFAMSADSDDEVDLDLDLTIDAEDPRAVLPEQLVAVLERELLLLPVRVRLEALVAAADLVSTWSDLVADHEKLLGHLVLAHAEPQASSGHEELIGRHAELHSATGPGHPEG
jgi:hypothetical protein